MTRYELYAQDLADDLEIEVDELVPGEDSEIPGLWWVGDENFPNRELAVQYAERLRKEQNR